MFWRQMDKCKDASLSKGGIINNAEIFSSDSELKKG